MISFAIYGVGYIQFLGGIDTNNMKDWAQITIKTAEILYNINSFFFFPINNISRSHYFESIYIDNLHIIVCHSTIFNWILENIQLWWKSPPIADYNGSNKRMK